MNKDLISRKAALNVIYEMHVGGKDAVEKALPNTYGEDLREIAEQISLLPPSQPEPKKGEWVYIGGDEWCCSECGNVVSTEGAWDWPCFEKYKMFHCNICGADMRGEKK